MRAKLGGPNRWNARSRSNSDHEGLRFGDDDLERRWLQEGVEHNIRNGAQMALLILGVVALVDVAGQWLSEGSLSLVGAVPSLHAALGTVAVPPLLCTIRWPRQRTYLPVLCAAYLVVMVYGFEPLDDCEGMLQDYLSLAPGSQRKPELLLKVMNLDCTLQGHTLVLYFMTLIFISPRLIPQHSMMWLNWVFILLFLCATITQNRIRKHQNLLYHSRLDTLSTVALLCAVAFIAGTKKWYFEKSQRARFAFDLKQHDATVRIFHILEYMVPEHVIVPMLKTPGKVIADSVERASILFVMIVDFDQHARRLGPEGLLAFLNKQFTQMDRICAEHSTTKIETVAEEYVCAVGVLPADRAVDRAQGHTANLSRLVRAAASILQMQAPGIQFKMGMHTGPVVAGVFGQKLPRFRLFGDTVNTAARMMQKGVPGQLQFGEETRRQLPDWVQVTPRGEIELKGKGKVAAFLLDAGHAAPPPATPAGPARLRRRRSVLEQAMQHADARDLNESFDAEQKEEEAEEEGESEDDDSFANFAGSQVPPSREAEGAADEKFEGVVQELRARDRSNISSGRWWCSCGLMTTDFTPSLELMWSRWFHDTVICKKLDYRLDKQATFMLVLTALEMAGCVAFGSVFSHPHWHREDGCGAARLPVFLVCRLSSFALIMAWKRAWRRRHWLVMQPLETQFLMLLTSCLVAALTFVSYDAMAVNDARAKADGMMNEQDLYDLLGVMNPAEPGKWDGGSARGYRRNSASFSLVFIPVYLTFTAQHPFRFKHSAVFTVLAASLMISAYVYFDKGLDFNLFFSLPSMGLFVVASGINSSLQYQAERNFRLRYQAARSVSLTHERIQEILRTLLPPTVVEEVRERPLNAAPPTHHYRSAIIAQSDLVGFTKLASTRRPEEVVQFIGELFGRFDELTDRHSIYKVETVGDAYIAGQADLPLTQRCWPVSVALFGLEMVRATQDWARSRGWSVNCRVGIAQGECIGGIVGTDMQRYHLFGELMTCLEVLESTAPEGGVQVSQACKEAIERQMHAEGIPRELLSFQPRRAEHLTTSKGDVHELSEVGGPTYVVVSSATFRGWVGA